MIKQALEQDAGILNQIISKEFPYRKFSKENIAERIKNPEILVLKKIFNKEIAGFIDVEIKERTGFINAVSVKNTFRKKGFGKELINYALEVLRHNNIFEAKLFVKKENSLAKKLYTSLGFIFWEPHSKKIDDSIVEVWGKELLEDVNYLN